MKKSRKFLSAKLGYNSRLAVSLTGLVLIAGCVVGPNYKRPDATTIPAAYTGATNVVTSNTEATNGWKVAQPQAQISKGDWWKIFGDSELNELETQASGANQQLKVAVARLAEARAQMDVTRAGLFPTSGRDPPTPHEPGTDRSIEDPCMRIPLAIAVGLCLSGSLALATAGDEAVGSRLMNR